MTIEESILISGIYESTKTIQVPASTTLPAGLVLGSMGSSATVEERLHLKQCESDASDGSEVPRYILAEAIVNEAESSVNVVAAVILDGVVNKNKIIFGKEGDTLATNNNIEKLRENGIIVKACIEA